MCCFHFKVHCKQKTPDSIWNPYTNRSTDQSHFILIHIPINFPDATMEFSFFWCEWKKCFTFFCFPSVRFSAFDFLFLVERFSIPHETLTHFFENLESKYFSLFQTHFHTYRFKFLDCSSVKFASLLCNIRFRVETVNEVVESKFCSERSFIQKNLCICSLFRFSRPEHWNSFVFFALMQRLCISYRWK